jgi:hypothetical protein
MKKRKIFKNKEFEVIKNSLKKSVKGEVAITNQYGFEVDKDDYFPRPSNDARYATLEQLKTLNELSLEKGYNRNLYVEDVIDKIKEELSVEGNSYGVWSGLKTNIVMLIPLMIHKHKHGKECESHVRCEVFTNGIFRFLTLDVPIEDYKSLEIIDWKEVA